ncbi:MAG: hypothetical protein QNJ37_22750 [Crocosphaera sp.]|nr:hypothetical protein [Crocosphaera sp.]
MTPTKESWLQQVNISSFWNKLVAVIAIINFVLVIFNMSYLPLRDVYLKRIPVIVTIYDPVKAIEPHPETTYYLETVDQLEQEIKQNGLETKTTEKLLEDLQQQSLTLLDENPFLISSKVGTLAQIKRLLRHQFDSLSAKSGFNQLWSQDYFQLVGTTEALEFFDSKLRPLLASNYFRPIDDNGLYVDEFWRIDSIFILFFFIEIMRKAIWRSLNETDVSFIDRLLRRWYDWLLLLPTWRWLRIIPVTVRLHQSKLVDFERILAQLTHEPAAYLADRISNFLLVRLINQTQDSVVSGEAAKALFSSDSYVKIGSINKVDAISDRLLELTIERVLPEVKPELEALLRHSLQESFKDSNVYQGIATIPGIQSLPSGVIEQLADYLAASTLEILMNSYADLEGRELFNHLSTQFKQSLSRELQAPETQSQLQSLLAELLEEMKINYVQKSQEEDPEATLEEAENLRQIYQEKEKGT